jgi:hypothetical protein
MDRWRLYGKENSMKEKMCSTCKVRQDIKEFSKKMGTYDGLNSQCKKCVKKYNGKLRGQKRERLSDYF